MHEITTDVLQKGANYILAEKRTAYHSDTIKGNANFGSVSGGL